MKSLPRTMTTLSPTLAAAVLLASCASGPTDATRADAGAIRPSADVRMAGAFPEPSDLRPQIDFWRNVYAVWSEGQVALHDNTYLNLVYEVVELPGSINGGYTDAQRDTLRWRYDTLQERLRELERKVHTNEPLTAPEQALAAKIRATAGFQAVVGAAERLRSQRGLRERFRRGLEISGRYDGLFRQAFREAGLPEDLAYLPHVESSFQAHARSSAGAVGMWQFTRGAARIYMLNHPALDERLDPVASARGAARYLRDAYGHLGDWSLAVTSYNHGIGGMRRARERFGTDFMRIVREYDGPTFGFASRNFYAEFLAAREVASRPQHYFPEGLRYEAPLDWDRVTLSTPARAPQLARQYAVALDQLISLNPAWTRAAHAGRLELPSGTEIWLPAGTLTRLTGAAGTVALAEQEATEKTACLVDGSC